MNGQPRGRQTRRHTKGKIDGGTDRQRQVQIVHSQIVAMLMQLYCPDPDWRDVKEGIRCMHRWEPGCSKADEESRVNRLKGEAPQTADYIDRATVSKWPSAEWAAFKDSFCDTRRKISMWTCEGCDQGCSGL